MMTFKRPCPSDVNFPLRKEHQVSDKKQRPHRIVASFGDCLSSAGFDSWKDQKEAFLQTGLDRWRKLVLAWPSDLRVSGELAQCHDYRAQMQLIADYLRLKSPNTKRARSLQQYADSLRVRRIRFPGSEADLYHFLCGLRDQGVKAPRGNAVVEALGFCAQVFGLSEFGPLVASKRCKGVGVRVANGPTRQADPLTVSESIALHRCLEHDEESWNKLAAGSFLLAVYSRSRWSDLQHTEKLTPDFLRDVAVYLNGTIYDFKTAQTAAFRAHFMTATAPGKGVCDAQWIEPWLKVRAELGLADGSWPPLPVPNEEGLATQRPATTSEAGAWLRFLLEKHGASSQGRRLTSHSLKTTMLSYLAKFGAPSDDRLLLGGHVSHLKSLLVYSRDSMARPLRVLEEMLAKIRLGEFRPDETRSGRFVAPSQSLRDSPREREDVDSSRDAARDRAVSEVEVNSDGESSVGATSSDSSVDTQVSDDELESSRPGPVGFLLHRHRRYKTIHLLRTGERQQFLCGRPVGSNFEAVERISGRPPSCSQCWRALEPRGP